jgi:hypothetical protein
MGIELMRRQHRAVVTVLTPVLTPVLTALVLAGLLSGCAGGRASLSTPETPVAAATRDTSPPSPAAPTTATTPVAGSVKMSAPAKRAGPLTGHDMPRPSALGQGWRFRVDDGNTEDGYAGNGTPTVRRDPSEVAGLAVPLGCVDRGSLPRPRWALESDYAHASTRTIGLVVRLRFGTAHDATTFMRHRDAALATCAAQTSSDGVNSTGLVQALRTVAGLTVSTRTEAGDLHDGSAWTEVAEVGSPDTDVMLVAVNALQSTAVARRAVTTLAFPG